jgi:phage regulator Rha-like protein
MDEIIAISEIQQQIRFIRGKRVIVDADLARFYGVSTKVLKQTVSRNIGRFPEDFRFQLTSIETRNLRSQFVTSSLQHGGSRYVNRVFTEQGVAMLASVLRGKRAVAMSVAIIRAFVQLREILAAHHELSTKLAELEQRIEGHDSAITNLFEAIRQILASPEPDHTRKIGFVRGDS